MAWKTRNGKTSEPNHDRRGTEQRHGVHVKDYSGAWKSAETITRLAAVPESERRASAIKQLFSRED